MALNCCCQVAGCQISTSLGYASVGAYKKDHLSNPSAGRPHCTMYRTLTLTVTDDSDGSVVFTAVVTNRFSDSTGPTPHPSLVSMSGGNPRPGETFTLAGISSQTETGFSLTLVSGSFGGKVRYDLSDAVSVADAIAVATTLASIVNFGTLPIGTGQSVSYKNGAVVTNTGVVAAPCSATGFYGASGTSGWVVYSSESVGGRAGAWPPEFYTTGVVGWLPLTSLGPTANIPQLMIQAQAWTSRMIISGAWCRISASMLADSNGFPRVCGISNAVPICFPGSTALQPAGGDMVFSPSGLNSATIVVCGACP